jgi:hypothetical protein
MENMEILVVADSQTLPVSNAVSAESKKTETKRVGLSADKNKYIL